MISKGDAFVVGLVAVLISGLIVFVITLQVTAGVWEREAAARGFAVYEIDSGGTVWRWKNYTDLLNDVQKDLDRRGLDEKPEAYQQEFDKAIEETRAIQAKNQEEIDALLERLRADSP